jgi:hypothetical protein
LIDKRLEWCSVGALNECDSFCVSYTRQFQDSTWEPTRKHQPLKHSRASTYSSKHPQHQTQRRTGHQANPAKQHRQDSQQTRHTTRHKHKTPKTPYRPPPPIRTISSSTLPHKKSVHHSRNSTKARTQLSISARTAEA